jgi:small conductance mechanosensitive channel
MRMAEEASQTQEVLKLSVLQDLVPRLVEFVVKYFFQLMAAAVLMAVGWWLAGKVGLVVAKFCERKKMDPLLVGFIAAAVKWIVVAVILITALGILGVNIAPYVAVLGAGTLGISLALQGPISNFGAGFVIILTRPFTIGDTISVRGVSGVVKDVRLGFTRLLTEDNELITIPNKHIVGEIQTNSKNVRIVESVVGVAYGSVLETALGAVRAAVESVPEVVKDPAPQIGVDGFGDSSIHIGYRYWVPSRSYHAVRFAVNRAVHDGLAAGGVTIPFPQQVVHLRRESPR